MSQSKPKSQPPQTLSEEHPWGYNWFHDILIDLLVIILMDLFTNCVPDLGQV